MSPGVQLAVVVVALMAALAYLVRHVVQGRGPLCTAHGPRAGGCGGCGSGVTRAGSALVRLPSRPRRLGN